jgi:excisionase family DNA binding protein
MEERFGARSLLTAAEVAAWLNVSRKSVHRWVLAGDLDCVRLGERTVRFQAAAVARFIERRGAFSDDRFSASAHGDSSSA